jgi:hypothetical protein
MARGRLGQVMSRWSTDRRDPSIESSNLSSPIFFNLLDRKMYGRVYADKSLCAVKRTGALFDPPVLDILIVQLNPVLMNAPKGYRLHQNIKYS